MDQTKFKKFLTLARKAIEYEEVREKEGNVLLSRKGNFTQGCLSYSDSSKGEDVFFGKEAIMHKGKVVWRRFYKGRITDNFLSKKEIEEVFSFLNEALSHFPDSHPQQRGPEVYEKENLEYTNICLGNFEKFNGTEKITKKGKAVYELTYHN